MNKTEKDELVKVAGISARSVRINKGVNAMKVIASSTRTNAEAHDKLLTVGDREYKNVEISFWTNDTNTRPSMSISLKNVRVISSMISSLLEVLKEDHLTSEEDLQKIWDEINE